VSTFGEKIKENLTILGLDNENEIDENKLKRAYLKQSKKYHPDVCEEKYKDGLMFKKINEANSFIKDNLSTVNDYLLNPSKYSYEEMKQSNNQYYYNTNMDDLFSQIFRAFQQSSQKVYSEEEINRIKKERRKQTIKRRIFAAFGLAFAVFIAFFMPNLGLAFSLIALLLLL